ncbi:MAG: hypothetical protein WC554_09420 [Clostridia bacterium]
MKKVICTYGTLDYIKSLELLEKTAYDIGKIDKVYVYTRAWLETTEFYRKNQYILLQTRGSGYFCWKPFIILETFKNLKEGDIVLYMDAGISIIDTLQPLFDLAQTLPNDGKVIFKVPEVGTTHKAKKWTKRDCFVLTGCDEEKYWDAPMTNGAVSLWVKNEKNIEFLNEWQKYLRDIRIISDEPNMCGKPNFVDFVDHRHDQSVLTILVTKYGYELFRDPTQWGNNEISLFANSKYSQKFHHHRNFKH